MNYKILFYFVAGLLITIFQSVATGYIRIFDVVPNLFLILTISNALHRGAGEGALIGLLLGFVYDTLIGKFLGINALFFMYVGLIIGSFDKKVYKESLLTAIFFTSIVSFMHSIITYIVFIFFRSGNGDWEVLLKISFIEMIYNSILVIFVHVIMSKLNNLYNSYEKFVRKY